MTKQIKTTHGSFIFRPYRNSDEDKVLAMWELAFGQTADKEIWRWKFHDCPFGRQTMLCLNKDGAPVSMYAGIPYPANWNGRDIYMTHMLDNMSHPEYRQFAIGKKSLYVYNVEYYFYAYRNQPTLFYLYGFPGLKHFKLGNIFLNYSFIKEGVQYMAADPHQIKNIHKPSANECEEIFKPIPQLDELWSDSVSHFPFSTKRNVAFIKWRYFDHPRNKYTIYISKYPNNKPALYVVVKYDDQTATIVDLLSKPANPYLGKTLFRIREDCINKNINTLRVWLPKTHFLSKCFFDMGFIPSNEPLGIFPAGQCFTDKLTQCYTNQNIYYTMGDGDLF